MCEFWFYIWTYNQSNQTAVYIYNNNHSSFVIILKLYELGYSVSIVCSMERLRTISWPSTIHSMYIKYTGNVKIATFYGTYRNVEHCSDFTETSNLFFIWSSDHHINTSLSIECWICSWNKVSMYFSYFISYCNEIHIGLANFNHSSFHNSNFQ